MQLDLKISSYFKTESQHADKLKRYLVGNMLINKIKIIKSNKITGYITNL